MIATLLALAFGAQGLTQPLQLNSSNSANLQVAVSPAPKPSGLQAAFSGPISIRMTGRVGTIYTTIAQIGGLNVVLDRDFVDASLPFSADKMEVFDALNSLALASKTFWLVLDPHTILVAPDTATKHRALDPQVLKTIQLPLATSVEQFNDLTQLLRVVLAIANLAPVLEGRAIVMKDTPAKIALAESLISSSRIPALRIGLGIEVNAAGSLFEIDGANVRNVTPNRIGLQIADPGPVSLSAVSVQAAYERIAEKVGLQVKFHDSFVPGPAMNFKVNNVNVLDALNSLSIASGNVWKVVDSNTIFVLKDTLSNRTDLESPVTKTFPSTGATRERANTIMTVLRAILELPQVRIDDSNGIEVQGTVNNVFLAERIIADLSKP